MKQYLSAIFFSLLVVVAGCDQLRPKADAGVTKADIEALKAGQEAILKDLAEIKKQVTPAPKQQQVSDVSHVMDVSPDPYKGSKTAVLTIVEYTDFQCPYCGRHAKSVLPEIQKNYVDTGKVRYVLRDFPLPFHNNASKAAEAAHCAGDQGKYWEMHDLLFDNQQALGPDKLPEYAKAIGIDVGKFDACLASNSYKQRVDANLGDAAKVGINGTPSFVIGYTQADGSEVKGEKLIRGAVGYDVFQQAFEEMAAKKK
jgi:protein-disulfide isomerase